MCHFSFLQYNISQHMLNSSTLFEYNGTLMYMHKLPCHYFLTVTLHYCYSYLVTCVSIYIYVSISPYSPLSPPQTCYFGSQMSCFGRQMCYFWVPNGIWAPNTLFWRQMLHLAALSNARFIRLHGRDATLQVSNESVLTLLYCILSCIIRT